MKRLFIVALGLGANLNGNNAPQPPAAKKEMTVSLSSENKTITAKKSRTCGLKGCRVGASHA